MTTNNRMTKFKKQPFNYIPKEYLIYIKEHAYLAELDEVDDFLGKGGKIPGITRLWIEMITLNNDWIGAKGIKGAKFTGAIALTGQFLQSIDKDFHIMNSEPLTYSFPAATGICALILDKAGIEFDVYNDECVFDEKDEAKVHQLLDPYVDILVSKVERNDGNYCFISFSEV